MTTRLTDLEYGDEWVAYSDEQATELNAFVQAGVAVPDADLDGLAAGQGGIYKLPFFKPLANDDPNISNDDPTVQGAAKKVTSGVQSCRQHMYNQIWGSADLTQALIAKDPLMAIGDKTAQYWATWNTKMMLYTALGIMADNVANDNADMVINVMSAANAVDRKLSTVTLIDALQTMGDAKNKLRAIGVHSVVHADLQKQGALLEHYDPETGDLAYETLMGKRLIVDDQMPVKTETISAAPQQVYASVLFGEGAFRLGQGRPKVAAEPKRDATAANGGGVEVLVERKHQIVHPWGFEWTEASVVGLSATKEELATAANWNRVYSRKNIPLAFVRTRIN